MPTLPVNPWSKAFSAGREEATPSRISTRDQRPTIANAPSVRKYQAQKTLEPVLDTILGLSPINALAQAASYAPEAEASWKTTPLTWIQKIAKSHPELTKYLADMSNNAAKELETGIVSVEGKPLGRVSGQVPYELEFPQEHLLRSADKSATYTHTHPQGLPIPSSWLQDPIYGADQGTFNAHLKRFGGDKEMLILSPSPENQGYFSVKADNPLDIDAMFNKYPALRNYKSVNKKLNPTDEYIPMHRNDFMSAAHYKDLGLKDVADVETNLGSTDLYKGDVNDWFDKMYGYYADKGVFKKDFASGGQVNTQLRPQGVLARYQAQLPQRQAATARASSVMSKAPSTERWQPEYEVEPGLEAPMFSPEDLIGSGIPTKLATMAKGLSPLAMIGGVIKNKGGNWLEGSVEGALKGLRKSELSPDAITQEMRATNNPAINQELQRRLKDTAINQWIDKPLANYVRNQMATPEDPIRALAERGVLHVPQESLVGGRNYVHPTGDELQKLGQSPMAEAWENASDRSIYPQLVGNIPTKPNEASWITALKQKAPATPIYSPSKLDRPSENLGFNHLIDELSNAINPESGLPRHLQFPAERLSKVSVPQAVERVDAINAWRAAMKAEADQAKANNAATVLHKEYPEKGMKWVELKAQLPEDIVEDGGIFIKGGQRFIGEHPGRQALQDALKYEGDTMDHCVGGYCDDVASGRSRIYSLRDAKGQPHVTIEVAPQQLQAKDLPYDEDVQSKLWNELNVANEDLANRFQKAGTDEEAVELLRKEAPELHKKYFEPQEVSRIVQIKGKQNRAPNPEYLPMVQDFVKSGKWSDVGDLQNTGLAKHPKTGDWITKEELDAYENTPFAWTNNQEFARGGSVRPNKIETVADLSAIIRAIQSGN